MHYPGKISIKNLASDKKKKLDETSEVFNLIYDYVEHFRKEAELTYRLEL